MAHPPIVAAKARLQAHHIESNGVKDGKGNAEASKIRTRRYPLMLVMPVYGPPATPDQFSPKTLMR
jgi:hypothetical protein